MSKELAPAPSARGGMGDLRILFIDDSKDDFDLVLRELERGGYATSATCVATAGALAAALGRENWDIAFLDWSMPFLTVPAALAILQHEAPELPVIIVSGIVEEESAVGALRAGARDFLTKQRLTRLLPSVQRALSESAERREHARARDELLIATRTGDMLHTPLATLTTNLELARLRTAELAARLGNPAAIQALQEELANAGESARSMRQIVVDTGSFSQGANGSAETVDVQSVLESSLSILRSQIQPRARLVKDYWPVPEVRGSPCQLGQIFLNLILNALQAIPEGQPERHELRVATRVTPSGKVELQIRDTGPGMPPAILKHVFAPFFSSKMVHQGGGLGLTVCQRIVRTLGGEIQVASTVGKGSTFSVILNAAPYSSIPPSPRAVAPSMRRGRVLVIDDEPLVTRAVRRALQLEHEVIEAHRAEDALEKIASGECFDVIISDLMLSAMSGMALHAQLEQQAPEQARRMVFFTSSPSTAQARDFFRKVTNRQVQKPFDLRYLQAVVNEQMRG